MNGKQMKNIIGIAIVTAVALIVTSCTLSERVDTETIPVSQAEIELDTDMWTPTEDEELEIGH